LGFIGSANRGNPEEISALNKGPWNLSIQMNVIINVIGPEITLKQEIALELVSPTLKEVMKTLQEQKEGPWKRLVKNDLSLVEGCVALVNGRNIMSLGGFETPIREGDEITFTVLVAGG